MRDFSKCDLIRVYQDLVDFLQLEDCYETNCKCMNEPDLLFEETRISRKMDPIEISIKVMNYSTDELGRDCLMRKVNKFLNKKLMKYEKRK